MANTIQKAFRLPLDVVEVLDAQPNATEFVTFAIREKVKADREQAIEASLQCLAFDDQANDISDFRPAQAKVIDLAY